MSYAEDLKHVEWTLKRLKILERDGYKCKHCESIRPIFRNISARFGVNRWHDIENKG